MFDTQKRWVNQPHDYNKDQSLGQQGQYNPETQKPEITRKPVTLLTREEKPELARKPFNLLTRQDIHNYLTKPDYKANIDQSYLPKEYRYHETDVKYSAEQLRLRHDNINWILDNQGNHVEKLDRGQYYEEQPEELEMQEQKSASLKPTYFSPRKCKNPSRKESEDSQKKMQKGKRFVDRVSDDPVEERRGFWLKFKGQMMCAGQCDEIREDKDKKVAASKGMFDETREGKNKKVVGSKSMFDETREGKDKQPAFKWGMCDEIREGKDKKEVVRKGILRNK